MNVVSAFLAFFIGASVEKVSAGKREVKVGFNGREFEIMRELAETAQAQAKEKPDSVQWGPVGASPGGNIGVKPTESNVEPPVVAFSPDSKTLTFTTEQEMDFIRFEPEKRLSACIHIGSKECSVAFPWTKIPGEKFLTGAGKENVITLKVDPLPENNAFVHMFQGINGSTTDQEVELLVEKARFPLGSKVKITMAEAGGWVYRPHAQFRQDFYDTIAIDLKNKFHSKIELYYEDVTQNTLELHEIPQQDSVFELLAEGSDSLWEFTTNMNSKVTVTGNFDGEKSPDAEEKTKEDEGETSSNAKKKTKQREVETSDNDDDSGIQKMMDLAIITLLVLVIIALLAIACKITDGGGLVSDSKSMEREVELQPSIAGHPAC